MRQRVVMIAVVLLPTTSAGCRSSDAPKDCVWHDSGSTTLTQDVKTAEDLAIRYADARGLTPGWREVRIGCEATLFAGVAEQHGVPMAELTRVRGELANRFFDPAVHLPMLLLTLVLSNGVSQTIKRRFSRDERPAFAAAAVFASIFVAALVVFAGHVLSAVLEVYRIGNGHLSYRASRIPWSHQWTQVFCAVCAVSVFAALMRFRTR